MWKHDVVVMMMIITIITQSCRKGLERNTWSYSQRTGETITFDSGVSRA
jgi:hypothetical protein